MGNLNDLLDVLDFDLRNLFVDVLNLDLRDLLHDLADLHLRHFDDLLLLLDQGNLLLSLGDRVDLLLDLLLDLLCLLGTWHLPHELEFLVDGDFDDLFARRDERHLDEGVFVLFDRLLDVHDLSLTLLFGDLPQEVHDLHLRDLDDNFLVQDVGDLNLSHHRLKDRLRDFLDPFLVANERYFLDDLDFLLLLKFNNFLAT
mmetsp:Transcript_4856/g.10432  ORF Transcript_4856/g.10432 Transcript_4856/m.10432 type:complete len:200 (-) Transcript_4856:324-923(-)